jgi:hypothetical protein
MKKQILMAAIMASSVAGFSQKYFTRTGYLSMFSKTGMEDIKAANENVTYIVDWATGDIQVSALQTNFKFEKAFMQEHYNENYMESTKFPKATFKGKIENVSSVNIKKDGTYTAKVSGTMELHGVAKPYSTTATFKVAGGHVAADAKFTVKCSDHNVKIEERFKNNISDSIEIKAKADLTELKK